MQSLVNKINSYWRLARFDRPIGTYLLLWPTLIALLYASNMEGKNAMPDFNILLIFTFGVILMRAAGCVINDYADRKFDIHVKRTNMRPLALEEISPKNVLIFFTVLVSLAFLLVLMTNTLTIFLAFIALVLASIYPFLKRYTNLPQLGLGVAFSWGIIMAFSATVNSVPHIAWILLLANIFWVLAYDTIYALDDMPYDKKIGVKSTAILFGKFVKEIVFVLNFIAWALFLCVGLYFGRSTIFITFMLIAALIFAFDTFRLRKAKEFLPIFLNNNNVGLCMFLGVFLDFLYA